MLQKNWWEILFLASLSLKFSNSACLILIQLYNSNSIACIFAIIINFTEILARISVYDTWSIVNYMYKCMQKQSAFSHQNLKYFSIIQYQICKFKLNSCAIKCAHHNVSLSLKTFNSLLNFKSILHVHFKDLYRFFCGLFSSQESLI